MIPAPAPLVLSPDQELGFDTFKNFYLNENHYVMLLKGYSGTGKTTLVRHILGELDNLDALIRLVYPEWKPRQVVLTATTNQAAEAFSLQSGGTHEVKTIHSALGLMLQKEYATNKSYLEKRYGSPDIEDALLFIDEASFIDQNLLSLIFTHTKNCKIVFMGDPAQFTPVGSMFMPAFKMNAVEVELKKLMRQNPGPLANLCNAFRGAVFDGIWPKIQPDDNEIFLLPPEKFDSATLQAFNDPDFFGNTKVLAYTNQRVIDINNRLSHEIIGTSQPQAGQRMMVNTAIRNKASSCNTGEEVFIESIEEREMFEIEGYAVKLRTKPFMWFLPKRLNDAKARVKLARSMEEFDIVRRMDEQCIDLRPSFSCTVNKSQGSTFDTVFLDLNDICKKIRNPNQLARALYVGLSRARRRVVLTGDM